MGTNSDVLGFGLL